MRRGPWWLPIVCGWLVACGREGDSGEGVFSARAPDGPLPAEDVVTPAEDVVAPTERAVADAAALRARLKELAVASECLRRGNTAPDTIASTMLALYRTHGIDLDTYTREMGRLGGDAAFQAEVQAALANCPTIAPAAVVADADVVEGVDAGESAADLVDESDAAADAASVDENPPDGVANAEPEDIAVATEADVAAGVAEPTEPTEPQDVGPDWSGTWTGAIRGGTTGTLRVSVRIRAITSATLTLGSKSVRLHGSVSSGGQMSLAGRIQGGGFVRLRGRIDKSGKHLQGTWDGMVDGRNQQGTMTLSR